MVAHDQRSVRRHRNRPNLPLKAATTSRLLHMSPRIDPLGRFTLPEGLSGAVSIARGDPLVDERLDPGRIRGFAEDECLEEDRRC